MLYMQQFKNTIKHTILGTQNAAEALSRLPVTNRPKEADKETGEDARTRPHPEVS